LIEEALQQPVNIKIKLTSTGDYLFSYKKDENERVEYGVNTLLPRL